LEGKNFLHVLLDYILQIKRWHLLAGVAICVKVIFGLHATDTCMWLKFSFLALVVLI